MTKRQSASKQDYPFLDRMADVTLIASLYTVLPFSALRLENFVSDKHALLGIFSLLILTVWFIKFAQGWRPDCSALLKQPIVFGVLGLIFFALISTIFSLSPTMSWVGKIRIPNGLYSLSMYLIIMLQTIFSIPRIKKFITPMLALIILFQMLWAILIDPQSSTQWLMSVAGNPNYLSAWLVLAIFVLAYEVYSNWMNRQEDDKSRQTKRRNTVSRDKYYRLLLIVIIFLAFAVMIYAGGRGALLALLTASVGTISILGVLQRRFRLVFASIGLALLLLISFIVVAANLPEIRNSLRFIRLGDANRYQLWEGGFDAIRDMNEPLIDYRGNEDSLSLLRPLIGYGPEMVSGFQSRWGTEAYYATHSRLSFHNYLLDAITERGIFGLIASLLVFSAPVYLLLKELNWLSNSQWPILLILMLIMAVILIAVLVLVSPDRGIKPVFVVGIGLSLPLSIYLWGMIQEFRRYRAGEAKLELTAKHIFLIFMVNLVIAHWIEIQFAFGQPLSEPLFYFVLGWIVYQTLPQSEMSETDEEAIVITSSQAWLVNIIMISLHLINLNNNVYFSPLKPPLTDLSMMFIVLSSLALIGAWLSHEARQSNEWMSVGIGLALWLVLVVVGSLMNEYFGARINSTGIPISIEDLPLLYIVAAASSIALSALMLLAWILTLPNYTTQFPHITISVFVITFMIGSSVYVMDFITATTTRRIWQYSINSDVESYAPTMELYDKMSESIILPREVLVPLLFSHLNYALLTQPLEASDEVTAHINDTWKALLDIEPYFNHSQQGWLFIDVYTSLYGNPPPSD